MLTREFLHQEYILENKTIGKIAEENSISSDLVIQRLKQFNIIKDEQTAQQSHEIEFYQEYGYWPCDGGRYEYEPRKSEKDLYKFLLTIELGYARFLDESPLVASWLYRSFYVDYNDESGKHQRYFPGFLVEYRDGSLEIVDVTTRTLVPNNKYLRINRFAKDNGARFRVLNKNERRIMENRAG